MRGIIMAGRRKDGPDGRLENISGRVRFVGLKERYGQWWRHGPNKGGIAYDPGTTMFALLRRRLTLWYTCILAGAMLLAGTALYFGTQQMLLAPVQAGVEKQAK